jgi:hypothetical protein
MRAALAPHLFGSPPQVSTLDLLDPQRLEMLLIASSAGPHPGSGGAGAGAGAGGGGAGAGGAAPAWAAAAAALRREGWPLRCVEVVPAAAGGGGGGAGSSSDSGRGAGWEVLEDAAGAWAALHGGAPGAAVLVRPDGHVAWRKLAGPGQGSGGGGGGGGGGEAACAVELSRALAGLGWLPPRGRPGAALGAASGA